MGSLSITPFSCTHIKPTPPHFNMKVFATLATILGVTYAAPEARMGSMDMMRSNMGQQQQLIQPRMDMMRSNMGQQQRQLMQPGIDMMAERKMSLKMSPMRTMYSP